MGHLTVLRTALLQPALASRTFIHCRWQSVALQWSMRVLDNEELGALQADPAAAAATAMHGRR